IAAAASPSARPGTGLRNRAHGIGPNATAFGDKSVPTNSEALKRARTGGDPRIRPEFKVADVAGDKCDLPSVSDCKVDRKDRNEWSRHQCICSEVPRIIYQHLPS